MLITQLRRSNYLPTTTTSSSAGSLSPSSSFSSPVVVCTPQPRYLCLYSIVPADYSTTHFICGNTGDQQDQPKKAYGWIFMRSRGSSRDVVSFGSPSLLIATSVCPSVRHSVSQSTLEKPRGGEINFILVLLLPTTDWLALPVILFTQLRMSSILLAWLRCCWLEKLRPIPCRSVCLSLKTESGWTTYQQGSWINSTTEGKRVFDCYYYSCAFI